MRALAVSLMTGSAAFCWMGSGVASINCSKETEATVVSLQGDVAFDSAGGESWRAAQLNDKICEGAQVWVKPNSRASLKLPGDDIIRLNENTVLTLKTIDRTKPSLLGILKGFIHFISRKPKEVKIESGIANAAPLGTEFAYRVDDAKAGLWVYEGAVRFFNQQGSVDVASGQMAEAFKGKPPQARIGINLQDAVNWALYYPPIVPFSPENTANDPVLQSALNEYRQGRIDLALQRFDRISSGQQPIGFYKTKAALRLIAGQVERAQSDIREIERIHPNDSDALALKSIIALTQNHKDEAFGLARQAVAAGPSSSTAYSALSYAEQGRFNLDAALAAAKSAASYSPKDAMTIARVAELELALGLSSDSERSARQALALDPNLERIKTVMGFALLSSTDTEGATQAFNQAVELDSGSPLARLGLGLAKIREGDLEEGRQDIEIAAALDPNNALVRSYLGKAYYEENRGGRADEQFKLAKTRDPKDPTPYFYEALKKQTDNKPVEALYDLQKAIELNDNRAVYRSRQLLDADRAARGATLARIYDNLGFQQRGVVETASSLQTDPTNYSAHRFLADTYASQQGRETAQLSEMLQAKMLQPVNINPVQPHLSVGQRGLLNSPSIANASFQDFTRLYERNRPQLMVSGIGGSQDSFGDETTLSGIYNKLSYSFGQFHFGTGGLNNQVSSGSNPTHAKENHDIYDIFLQAAITEHFNTQFEYTYKDTFLEHTNLNVPGSLRDNEARVGFHWSPSLQNHVLGLYSHKTQVESLLYPNINLGENRTADLWEGQSLNQLNNLLKITSGFSHYSIKHEDFRSFQENGFNLYAYSNINPIKNLGLTLGLSYDKHDPNRGEPGYQSKWNPKVGLQYDVTDHAKIRMAYMTGYKRPLIVNQTLENTQIAGFNQLFDDFNNHSFELYGGAIDFSWPGIFSGFEYTHRKVFEFWDNHESVNKFLNKYKAYLYYAINNNIALNVEYKYESNHLVFSNRTVNTHKLPLKIQYFNPNGLFFNVASTYVLQDQFYTGTKESSNFTLVDLGIGYRLPKRFGIISLDLKNIFDKHFRYNNTLNLDVSDTFSNQIEFYPDFTVLGNVTLSF